MVGLPCMWGAKKTKKSGGEFGWWKKGEWKQVALNPHLKTQERQPCRTCPTTSLIGFCGLSSRATTGWISNDTWQTLLLLLFNKETRRPNWIERKPKKKGDMLQGRQRLCKVCFSRKRHVGSTNVERSRNCGHSGCREEEGDKTAWKKKLFDERRGEAGTTAADEGGQDMKPITSKGFS